MIICLGTTPAVQRVMVFKKLEIGEVNRAVEVHQDIAGKSVNVPRCWDACQTGDSSNLSVGAGAFIRMNWIGGIKHDFCDGAATTRCA
jgi:fructose-1-phosphate kinase PfkB-like protein